MKVLQCPEQQSASVPQTPLSAWQEEPQTFPSHPPEQHSSSALQACPSPVHMAAQTPPLHSLEQHAEPPVQAAPPGRQGLQAPPTQRSEQHC